MAFHRSESIANLAKALAQAQAELKNPPKDRINPHYRSKYADLATIRDTVLPVLNKYGLSVMQLPCELPDSGNTPSRVGLWTLLFHESGEYIGSCIPLFLVKNDPQGLGSALTYARRYALQALVGVAADEDDDGELASSKDRSKSTRRNAGVVSEIDLETIKAIVKTFQKYDVTPEDIVAQFGKKSLEELTPTEIETLRDVYRKLSRGEPVWNFFPGKQVDGREGKS